MRKARDRSSYAALVRNERQRRGLSVQALANLAGIDRPLVEALENKGRSSAGTMQAISFALWGRKTDLSAVDERTFPPDGEPELPGIPPPPPQPEAEDEQGQQQAPEPQDDVQGDIVARLEYCERAVRGERGTLAWYTGRQIDKDREERVKGDNVLADKIESVNQQAADKALALETRIQRLEELLGNLRARIEVLEAAPRRTGWFG